MSRTAAVEMSGAPRALYLMPDPPSASGGITRHSRLVLRVLNQLGMPVTIVALHGTENAVGSADDRLLAACNGNKLEFAYQAIRALGAHPDLIVSAHIHLAPLAVTAARLSSVPCLIFAHGIEAWEQLGRLRAQALRRCDRILAVSHFTAERLQAANDVRVGSTSVVHSALEPDGMHECRATCTTAGPPRILTVARMARAERYKGHERVIGALPALLPRFPGLTYDIVGEGDLRPELEALVGRLGVQPAVRFHGWVPEERLAELYAGASAFVMPSSGEGFGFVFLEAMAHGLPIVAGDVDATPEVVTHGEAGLLVDPEDSTAILAAIGQLLADPNLARRMGASGRERTNSYFAYPRFRAELQQHIEFLVGGASRSRTEEPSVAMLEA